MFIIRDAAARLQGESPEATMTTPSERRDAQRIVVGPDHTVRFLVRGHPFRGVRITNLSLGGCFAMVGARDAGLFPAGTLLEQFTFEHPALPQSPLTAEVRYCLGSEAGSAPMAVLGLGIMFQALAPAMESGLRAHLDRLLGAVD